MGLSNSTQGELVLPRELPQESVSQPLSTYCPLCTQIPVLPQGPGFIWSGCQDPANALELTERTGDKTHHS